MEWIGKQSSTFAAKSFKLAFVFLLTFLMMFKTQHNGLTLCGLKLKIEMQNTIFLVASENVEQCLLKFGFKCGVWTKFTWHLWLEIVNRVLHFDVKNAEEKQSKASCFMESMHGVCIKIWNHRVTFVAWNCVNHALHFNEKNALEKCSTKPSVIWIKACVVYASRYLDLPGYVTFVNWDATSDFWLVALVTWPQS